MKRRFFLSLPFVAAAARALAKVSTAVRTRWTGWRTVGKCGDFATLNDALRDAAPGATIFIVAGHEETFTEALSLPRGASVIGMNPDDRPAFRWKGP